MKKSNETTKKQPKNMLNIENVTDLEILRVKPYNDTTTFFDARINFINIYSLKFMESDNGDWVAWPDEKGKDGKYYPKAKAFLSSDIVEAIKTQIQAVLDSQED